MHWPRYRAQVMKYQSPLVEKFTLDAFYQRGVGYAYDGQEAKSLDLTKENILRRHAQCGRLSE